MISLKNKVILAPMAGVTDRAFREICMKYGADMCFTEMVSIKGLYYNDKKTKTLLEISDREKPVYAQIFGHEPDVFSEVVNKAASFSPDGIDINCGCPAKKIVGNHDGGFLMKNPGLIYDIICSVREKTSLPVSVKIRLGWDGGCINAAETARLAERAGASHITVHGRTVKQGYSGNVSLEGIKKVVESVNIPVIGNGDILSARDAENMLSKTGCTAVMIGRGALGNPFIFRSIKSYFEEGVLLPEPSEREKIDAAIEHISAIVKYKGEYAGIKEARKHAIWYIKGMKNSARVKQLITSAETFDEMKNLLRH